MRLHLSFVPDNCLSLHGLELEIFLSFLCRSIREKKSREGNLGTGSTGFKLLFPS